MEIIEELAHLRAVADKQKTEISDLREMLLSSIETSAIECWCNEKIHTQECLKANTLLRVYRRAKGRKLQ